MHPMPYKLQQSGPGYYVVNSETGRRHSKRPIPRKRAVAQMRRLYQVENKEATPYTLDEFTAIALKADSDSATIADAAMRTPELLTIKGEQIAPGITRIRGNLCNVHGRYGPCDAAQSGKRKPAKGRKRTARKPIKTEAQRQQEQQAKRAAVLQQRHVERQANRINTVAKLRNQPNAAAMDALGKLERGEPIDADIAKALAGETSLVQIHQDGTPTLSATGRAFLHALDRGDVAAAEDAQARAQDQQTRSEERQQAAGARKRATEQRMRDVEARRQQRAADAAKRRAGGGKKPQPKPERAPRQPLPSRGDTTRVVSGGGGALPKPAPKKQEKPPPPQLPQALTDAVQALSEGRDLDEATQVLLIRNGLAKRNRDGVLVLTAAGQRATKKEITEKAQTAQDRAIFAKLGKGGGKGKGKLWGRGADGKRRPTRSERRRLVDSANTERRQLHRDVQRYDSIVASAPKNSDSYRNAARRLRALGTKLRQIDDRISRLPDAREKSFTVFKQVDGHYRWVGCTTNAYLDRDAEIISTKALEADCARADADGLYGPLRWWHVGEPDPFDPSAPWGMGLDIGSCDFNAMSGRMLIESGMFHDDRIGAAVAANVKAFQFSPGFFHGPNEPDAQGIYHHIRRFERSLVPAGRAANPYTWLRVKGHTHMIEEKIKDLVKRLGGGADAQAAVAELVDTAGVTQKELDTAGVAFKDDLRAIVREELHALLRDETATVVVEEKALPPDMPTEDDATMAEEPVDMGMDDGEDSGLTLSPDDLQAIGEAVGAALSTALQPLLGAMDLEGKMGRHMEELKAMFSGYQRRKDDTDATRVREMEALRKQANDINARLKELEGDQSRYRASTATDNVIPADVLAATKEPQGGPFDDMLMNFGLSLTSG